nr:unnamed protein product [Callosobruchus analis]
MESSMNMFYLVTLAMQIKTI